MDKCIYNEKNGLWYELQGNYYLPCLKLPEEETAHIGIWGQRHLRYLKQYHKCHYYNLLTSGKPNALGTEDEQPPQRRYGDRFKQFDLRITSYRKGCCQATAAFLFREVFKKS